MNRVNLRFIERMDATSSDDAIEDSESFNLRKKLRKRRKMRSGFTKSQLQDIETISDGDSDEAVDINDSDCSETRIQSAVLGHGATPYLNDSHLIGMLSGGENDGSYSSPLSQKSGKNMADFDDDDSPCEEELAQFAPTSHCLTAFAQTQRSLNVTEHFHGSNASASKQSTSRMTSNAKKSNAGMAPTLDAKVGSSGVTVNEIAQPANFLLWDLLMDDKIVSSTQ